MSAPNDETPNVNNLKIKVDDDRPAIIEKPKPIEPVRCELEPLTQCSKSHLWKLMESFYERKGPDSWSQGIVPHFITCNTFIAKSYVKVLHGFIRDSLLPGSKMPLNKDEPLYIIELGTGAGKFSFFMLQVLEEMQAVCDFPFDKIVYVMTDFTETNFNFWKTHPALKKYFDSGRLDAAIFNATEDRSIKLWQSGKVLEKGVCKNPICVVANYLFDTLYHDIFQIDMGQLKEGLVSTGSKHATEPDPLDPEIINRLENIYQYNPISTNYYSDEEGDEQCMRRILEWYVDYFKSSSASILVPIGALRALRRLGSFSGGRAIVISGDKGNNNPDQMSGLSDPHIALHGSFSLMVNYHAIGAWFTSRGGFALHNPQEEASLKVSTFILSPQDTFDAKSTDAKFFLGNELTQTDETRALNFPYLKQEFNDTVNQFGPNDFFVLQKSMKEEFPNPSLKSVVSLLKLGDWDTDVFFKFKDAILSGAPTCGQKLRNDLCRGMPRIWEHYYQLDMDKDIAFEIGRFYYGIRDYDNALFYYSESISGIGEHHVTFHNQGLCHYSLDRKEVALECFRKALAMNKDYEKARSWIEKVETELKAREAPPAVPASISEPAVVSENDNGVSAATATATVNPPAPPSA